METLLSLEQAAQLLNMRPSQLYELTRSRSRLRQAHPIPFLKPGKSIRLKPSSLKAWVDQLEIVQQRSGVIRQSRTPKDTSFMMTLEQAVQKMCILQIYSERSGTKTGHIQRLVLREFGPDDQDKIITRVMEKLAEARPVPVDALGGYHPIQQVERELGPAGVLATAVKGCANVPKP